MASVYTLIVASKNIKLKAHEQKLKQKIFMEKFLFSHCFNIQLK